MKSNLKETLIETNERLEALMEINLTTEEMLVKLHRIYGEGWEVTNEKPVLLSTDAITFVVKKLK